MRKISYWQFKSVYLLLLVGALAVSAATLLGAHATTIRGAPIQGKFTTFRLLTNCGNPGVGNGCDPAGITRGPDGNFWFTGEDGNLIGRITPAGSTTVYPLPTNCGNPQPVGGGLFGCAPKNITVGSDGALWFTEEFGNQIGRIDTNGRITEFPLPTDCGQPPNPPFSSGCAPHDITAGPDGALWFTEEVGNQIGRVTTGGFFTEFPIPTANSSPFGITVGPDHALWFTEENSVTSNQIGRVTITGVFTEFPTPTTSSRPTDITTGPDHALWFTESNANKIGRLTTSGLFNEYAVITQNSGLQGIINGGDGTLWFTEADAGNLGRITLKGNVSEVAVPITGTNPSKPVDLVPGNNQGVIWFTESGANSVGKFKVTSS